MLKSVEEQALRCKEIVRTLLVFSNDLSRGASTELWGRIKRNDSAELLQQVLTSGGERCLKEAYGLKLTYPRDAMIRGNATDWRIRAAVYQYLFRSSARWPLAGSGVPQIG